MAMTYLSASLYCMSCSTLVNLCREQEQQGQLLFKLVHWELLTLANESDSLGSMWVRDMHPNTHNRAKAAVAHHTTQHTPWKQNILEAKVFVKTASWCCCASEPNNKRRQGTVVIRRGVCRQTRTEGCQVTTFTKLNSLHAWLTALWGYTRSYATHI